MHQSHPRLSMSSAMLASILAFGLMPQASHAQQCPTRFEQQPGGIVSDGNSLCQNAVNKKCTFELALCVNDQSEGTCTPQDLKKKKVHAAGACGAVGKVNVKASGTTSVCGTASSITVKAKKRGTKEGTCTIRAKGGKSSTKITLRCEPASSPCPTTTTTTTTVTNTTTTTTTLVCLAPKTVPTCGNGIVDPGEQCDPPCGQGQCAGGQYCNGSCQCVPTTACACGASAPTMLDFTTAVGTGNCGAAGAGGGDVLCLQCGGLYFGGGAAAVPLPARVPDMGSSLTNVTACSGACLTLANTTSTETGSIRNCTGVGCFFGPPLPIPNTGEGAAALSTCVINTVAQNATGFAQCDNGASNLNLPLTSTIYLTADLLNGATKDRPDVPGIQPCPICAKACLACQTSSGATNTPCTSNADCTASMGLCGVGTCASDADCAAGIHCSAAPQCLGGPNDGLACMPGDSDVPTVCLSGTNRGNNCSSDADCPGSSCNHPYPTSHDCPPPASLNIGSLPIPFALTTGTSTKAAVASGTEQRVFCGFCRDTNSLCFEGDPNAAMDGCPMPAGSLHPCTSNADCTAPYASCEQRDQGAFHQGPASSLLERGSPAGNLTDDAAHSSTLVSVFCIPPTFNPAVDASADLPGPGAVSLPDHAQLLP